MNKNDRLLYILLIIIIIKVIYNYFRNYKIDIILYIKIFLIMNFFNLFYKLKSSYISKKVESPIQKINNKDNKNNKNNENNTLLYYKINTKKNIDKIIWWIDIKNKNTIYVKNNIAEIVFLLTSSYKKKNVIPKYIYYNEYYNDIQVNDSNFIIKINI